MGTNYSRGDIGEIKGAEIIKKYLMTGRMHIKLRFAGRTFAMPHANYVWLKNNPSFSKVPDGYVLHHLDLDPSNDDVSNLALMAKHHHTAYHFKCKNINIPVTLNGSDGIPQHRPTTYQNKGEGYWNIRYYVRLPDGRLLKKNKYSLGNRKRFKTKEDAEKAISQLWPGSVWDAEED